MPHRAYKFAYLQLFNVKYKFILQLFNVKYKFINHELFGVKFLFTEKYIFHNQKRTTVYGCTSLVSDFKLNRENDSMLSSRNRYIFEVPHLCTSILKCGFPTKGIKLTRSKRNKTRQKFPNSTVSHSWVRNKS